MGQSTISVRLDDTIKNNLTVFVQNLECLRLQRLIFMHGQL